MLIAVCCLGFVVFGTSKQSLSGLKHLFLKGPPPGRELAPYDEFLGKVLCFFLAFLGLLLTTYCLQLVPLTTYQGGALPGLPPPHRGHHAILRRGAPLLGYGGAPAHHRAGRGLANPVRRQRQGRAGAAGTLVSRRGLRD